MKWRCMAKFGGGVGLVEKGKTFSLKPIKYRGSHGNSRLWRKVRRNNSLGLAVLFSMKQETPISIGRDTFTNRKTNQNKYILP